MKQKHERKVTRFLITMAVALLVGGIWAGAWLLLRGAPGPVRAAKLGRFI